MSTTIYNTLYNKLRDGETISSEYHDFLKKHGFLDISFEKNLNLSDKEKIEYLSRDEFKWLLNGKKRDAIVSIKDGKVYWFSGQWLEGFWDGGIWVGGEWSAPDFQWISGEWKKGSIGYHPSDLSPGRFLVFKRKYGFSDLSMPFTKEYVKRFDWLIKAKKKNAEVEISWEDGEDKVYWKGGKWISGDWKGGYIQDRSGESETWSDYPPGKSLSVLVTKELRTNKDYKINPVINRIKEPNLQYLADFLLKKGIVKDFKENVKIIKLKEIAKKEPTLNSLFTKDNIVKTEINRLGSSKTPFISINYILELDKQLQSKQIISKEEKSLFKKYIFGKETGFDFTPWEGGQRYFREKNYAFLFILKKPYYKQLLRELNKSNCESHGEDCSYLLKDYYEKSNHPSNNKDLTLGWIRYTVLPEKDGVVLDEIQTDIGGGKNQILGKEYSEGWEEILMSTFIKFVRQNLRYRKIYMPTYQTKKSKYHASPPLYLYKDLPKQYNFKKDSDLDGFMILEKKRV